MTVKGYRYEIKEDRGGLFYEARLFIEDKLILSFRDERKEAMEPRTFIRIFHDNNSKYTFINGEIVSKVVPIKNSMMTRSSRDATYNAKIITMDLETYTDKDGVQIPFAAGYFDGKESRTFYSTDFEGD